MALWVDGWDDPLDAGWEDADAIDAHYESEMGRRTPYLKPLGMTDLERWDFDLGTEL